MAKKKIETCYAIREVSADGLIKESKHSGYGLDSPRFYDDYTSMDEVDEAILKDGEKWTTYTVLIVKRITDSE